MHAIVHASCGERRALWPAPVHACRSRWRATPPHHLSGARERMSRTVARDAVSTGRRLCAIVAHGGARHSRPTYTNWSCRWPPPCAHVAHGGAHGVWRSGCTREGGGAPPVRRLRGGVATTVFDF
ncbi:hypothetical protein F511_47093 [Dorcoceras hygrometricum]|uniref:Uncharacterized protein n=1 Tax=Dorcoceras hygrometricum TaxID=472368 RepID=A0A2Z6ZRW5_9LAMI|nr:hypothetical protein F511_47093 [Dorcoceras hygrometricum]